MSLVEQWHREHVERRRRIAARAVHDDGIDLKRKRAEPEPEPVIALETPTDNIIDLALMRLIRDAERVEAIMADRNSSPVLVNTCADQSPLLPPIRAIQTVVASFYQVEFRELLGERRHAAIVYPRHVAMYLCRHLTRNSHPAIGRAFGGRDHTTILSAVGKIERLCQTDERLRDDLQLIVMRLMEMGYAAELPEVA